MKIYNKSDSIIDEDFLKKVLPREVKMFAAYDELGTHRFIIYGHSS